MKRKKPALNQDYHATWGDIRSDFTPEQLQAIGAVAMNYNELEAIIDSMLGVVIGLSGNLMLEISTRINGMEGKVEIIKQGAKSLEMAEEDLIQLCAAFGKEGFMLLKGCRDAVIHARAHNSAKGIGVKTDRRAATLEILLTKEALLALYDRISALKKELLDGFCLLAILRAAPVFASKGVSPSTIIQRYSDQFRTHRAQRQALPSLPEFPSESELREARDTWFQARRAELLASLPQI